MPKPSRPTPQATRPAGRNSPFTRSGLDHLGCALLEVGLFRDRAGRIEGQLVDQTVLVEERNEDEALGYLVTALRIEAQLDLATPARHLDHVTALEAALLRILRVHPDHGVGEGLVQLGHATGHRTA